MCVFVYAQVQKRLCRAVFIIKKPDMWGYVSGFYDL